MAKGNYSEETKAAVMASLLAGQSVSEVSKQYNIPRGTIAGWSTQIDRTVQTDPNTKKEIGDLILDYLKETLVTLKAQVKVFADEKWIKQQSASEVAVLHGVIADKTIRLLEAIAETETD